MAKNTKDSFVVDTSFVLAFLLSDEKSDAVVDLFERYIRSEIVIYTTTLLRYELANALRSAVLRKRCTKKQAEDFYTAFTLLDIAEISVDMRRCLALSLEKNISCYDASYLLLSKRKHATLLTFDKALKATV